MSEEQQPVQVSMIWPDAHDLHVFRANQFLGQWNQGPDGRPEDFVLTIGHVSPPIFLGSVEEQRATALALGAVSVKALARVSMSRKQVDALIQMLELSRGVFDSQEKGTTP